MSVLSVTSDEEYSEGFLLDIEPLLSPYLQQGKLSIRIERLPPRSRLSKGRNNGDATFSLKPDDLDNLFFMPAEESDGSDVTLAVRVVKLDSDSATTLAVIDLPVSPAPESEQSARPSDSVAERPRNGERETNRNPAKLTVESLRKKGKTPAENEQVEIHKLQRAFDVLTKSLAETEARAEHAERKAEDAEARIADYEAGGGGAVPDADRIRADVSQQYEQELAQLRHQLDMVAGELEEAHKRALKEAETSHAREFEQSLEVAKKQLKKQLTKEFDDRVAKTLRGADENALAHLEKERQNWESNAQTALSSARENWRSEEAQRQAAAKKAFEAELSDLREQFTSATDDIGAARKQATEIAAANRAREIAELQTTHERSLEENTAATKAELERAFETRLAEIRREANQTAELHLSEERKKWEAAAEAAQSKAKDAWQMEEAKRRAEATAALEVELVDLRQQLAIAADEIGKVREQASTDTETWHAREIEELQRAHASDLEEKVTATKKQLEQEFADRLADASREAEEKAEARLTKEHQKLEKDTDAALSAARNDWKDEESARLAEEKAAHEVELSDLQVQLDAATGEIAELREKSVTVDEPSDGVADEDRPAATGEQVDNPFEDRLAEERKVWEAGAAEALERARANWKTAEEERLAAAKRVWQKGLRTRGNSGRGRRSSGRWRFNSWMPRRSRLVMVAIVGLIALVALHPDIKFFVLRYSAPVVAEIKSRVEPLLDLQPIVMQSPQPDALAAGGKRVVVGVESANIRVGPSTTTNVVGSLSRGDTVVLLDSQGDWLRVRFGAGVDKAGWIHRNLLSGSVR